MKPALTMPVDYAEASATATAAQSGQPCWAFSTASSMPDRA